MFVEKKKKGPKGQTGQKSMVRGVGYSSQDELLKRKGVKVCGKKNCYGNTAWAKKGFGNLTGTHKRDLSSKRKTQQIFCVRKSQQCR